MNKFCAAIKLTVFILWALVLASVQWIFLFFVKGPASYFLPQIFHAGCAKILNIKFTITGTPVKGRQVFFVSNHLSHFDIFVLGSLLRASFVAKEEVEHWAVFGFLANLQQTAYISRASSNAIKAKNHIEAMIESGKSIILFPEGTSTRGESVLDFKSTLFTLPLQYADKGMAIQPITIVLKTVDGKQADTKELRIFMHGIAIIRSKCHLMSGTLCR